jgi:hypothetical protein
MPNKLSRKQKCTNKAGNSEDCKEETLCPGWDKTVCFGIFPEAGKGICRPCESGSEAWISVEHDVNYGVCACLPQPIDTLYKHRENLTFIAVAMMVYILFMTGIGRRIRRRII